MSLKEKFPIGYMHRLSDDSDDSETKDTETTPEDCPSPPRKKAPTNHVASKLIKHLIEELDVMGDVLESHIVHSLEVRERCTEALQDGIRMREEFVEKMRCITTQLMDARLMNEGQLAATIQVYREHEAEINRLKEETESFTKKEKELHSESVLGFQTMKDRHYEIEDQWKAEKKKLKKRLIGIDELETDSEKGEDDDYEEEDEEKKDEEKMNKDILEMKEKIAKYEKEWRELEKSVDPSVGKLNRQLTHLFGEQQASYAVLVERYISGEDLANEERRKAAETIRALKLHLLEGKKGKEKTKKVHEVEAEYKERMEYVQEKNLDVKKVVEEMKTELENLSMETFGEGLEEETKQKLWETSKLPSFVSATGMCTQSLAARLFHKLSFSAGVVETAFEKLLTQTRINIQHEYKAIEQKTKSADTWNDLHKQIMKSKTLEESQSFVKGITVIVDDEDEQQNIKDLNAFFTAMQNTKSRMSYYYNDALKEADEIGIDFSLGKKTGEEVEGNGEGTSPKTAAETVRDNNRRTRDSYIGGNFPATPEEFQQWQQKMMLINQNIKEKEKQLLEMKRRWEIEENVQKARYQQEVDQLLKEMDEAKGDREKEKEMEKKMAAWFKNKEELRKTLPLSTQAAIEASDAALVVSTNAPGLSPAPPSPPSPVPKFTTDEMRAFFTNQVLEKTKNDPEKAKELEQRVSETVYETFEMCKKFAETGKLDLTRKDQKIESLEARISDLEAKLEEKHQEYLKKDRQLSNLETGYLRRGLGISRHQLRNGRSEGGGAKEEKKAGPNSVNQMSIMQKMTSPEEVEDLNKLSEYHQPKDTVIDLMTKVLQQEKDKVEGYVKFVRDRMEQWMTVEMPMGNKLFETDRIKRVLETIEKQDRLIASLNDKIETLSTQSQYNMKLDTDCIRELRTQVIKATPNMYEKERAVTMKMISDEYDQRTRVLEESKNRLIDHKNVMLTFSKRKELEQRARGLHHPVDYHISRWEQMWAEQGGEVKQAANKKKVEKSKKQLEFEVSQWSKECGMYAVFNEFLMDQILLADTRLAVVEATNADHHTTIEEMRKKCKIADNVRDARQQQEIDLLKQKYSDMVAVMMEQIVMLKGYQQIQLSENPTLEEKCEKMGNELNRMVANLPNSEKSQTLLEKENQELDKMDKEIDKQVDAVRIAALVNIRKEYHRKSALDILHSIKDCRSVDEQNDKNFGEALRRHYEDLLRSKSQNEDHGPMGSPLFTDEDQLITNLPPHLQKINNLNKSQQSQKPQKSEKIQMGGAPNIPKFPHEEINKIFAKVDKTQAAVLKEIIKKQEERLKILEDQVSEKSKIEDMSDEEKTRKIEELERKTKEMEEKMENYERKLVEKERQMAIIDNGYLQFGLGMTRFQSSAGRMPDDPMPKIDGKLGIRNVQGVYGNS
ncbi:hypothetical protein L3Y34_005391 [Caenorhabditis briggsae]|uniref:Uncharacterized protein n=1 Tax=Caenorhabditis briggsae TaxID=6238 RepID=A0AAE9AEC1_CAEBR|nr:hypothetical protein L3Y34_005391 [Caenorhabditis briggsae]